MLLHSSLVAAGSCRVICRNSYMLSYMPTYLNMLNGWHVHLICWPWDVFSFQNVYRSLQHGVVYRYAATWGDGLVWMAQLASRSNHNISVRSKCNQWNVPVFVVYNIHLPMLQPTTMGQAIHNVFSTPVINTTAKLSDICPVQWKPWFIYEENISPKWQTPLNTSICPLN